MPLLLPFYTRRALYAESCTSGVRQLTRDHKPLVDEMEECRVVAVSVVSGIAGTVLQKIQPVAGVLHCLMTLVQVGSPNTEVQNAADAHGWGQRAALLNVFAQLGT